MKRVSLLLILLFSVSMVFAQSGKTPKIEKAKIHLDKGEIAEAKVIIDEAIVHEKTKDKVKTWYYRGLIYEAIYNSEDQAVSSLSDDAFIQAAEAFMKVKEMEKETGTYYIFSDQRILALYSDAFNAAAQLIKMKTTKER